MNDTLLQEFTATEVKVALDSIGDLKAPGPDGMPAVFYKRFWENVGDQVKEEALQVLNRGQFPPGWNDTPIVFIPKVMKLETVKDLRPISLCNVLFKIVSKVLATRSKVLLLEVISPAQSVFVPGRLILDNILVAYELTHYMKRKIKGKREYAAGKLNISKAYDRVEWQFLQDMMVQMGFHARWIALDYELCDHSVVSS